MVRSRTLDKSSILQALAQGHFSGTGPVIEELTVVTSHHGQRELHVRCSPCQQIIFYAVDSRGQRFVAASGDRVTHARLSIQPEQIYVRVECRDHGSGCAWSNPVYVTDVVS